MGVILGVSVCIAVVLLIFFSAYKALRYARMPVQGSMAYSGNREGLSGGKSGFTEGKVNKVYFIKNLLKEMLFFDRLPDHKRTMWWLSYVVWAGACLMAVWTLLVVTGALAMLAGAVVEANGTLIGAFFYYLTIPVGACGFLLATFGVGMLIMRRMNDPALRKNSTMQEFFALFLLFAALVTGVLLWGGDLTFAEPRRVVAEVLSLSPGLYVSPLLGVHMVLLNIMFIYIPLSRMNYYVEDVTNNV